MSSITLFFQLFERYRTNLLHADSPTAELSERFAHLSCRVVPARSLHLLSFRAGTALDMSATARGSPGFVANSPSVVGILHSHFHLDSQYPTLGKETINIYLKDPDQNGVKDDLLFSTCFCHVCFWQSLAMASATALVARGLTSSELRVAN